MAVAVARQMDHDKEPICQLNFVVSSLAREAIS
jgi:hypothetical protein